MKKAKLFFFLLLLASIYNLTEAQVTIGSTASPMPGALLDLKEDVVAGSEADSKRGMMLPRVLLSDKNKLYPMLSGSYDPAENLKHAGLMVYNLEDNGQHLCKGIFVWTGDVWNRVPEACIIIGFDKSELLFYKSAPHPKTLKVDAEGNSPLISFLDLGGGITWRAGGIPTGNHSPGQTHSFQPAVNTTSGALENTIEVKANNSINQSVKIIKVKQLERDLNFTHTPSTLGAAGGSASITVDSEADWQITTKTDPSSIVSAFPGGVVTAGAGKTYTMTTNANPSYSANRNVTLHVTSPLASSYYLDFADKNIILTQGFVAPYINTFTINNVAATTLNIGESLSQAYSIKFNTNAKWKYSATGHFANIVTSPSAAQNTTIASGATATVGKPQTYSFTSSGDYSANAGTNYSTTLTFTTDDHSPATAKTQNIILNRTVPVRLAGSAMSPANGTTISRIAQNITVSATTNTPLSGVVRNASAGGAQLAEAAAPANTGYVSRTATVTVPANASWSNRSLTVHTKISSNVIGNVGGYTQSGYTFNNPRISLSNLPRAGGNIGVTVSSDGPWSAHYNYTSDAAATARNTASQAALATTAQDRTVTIASIPANDSWGNYSLRVYTTHNGSTVHRFNVTQPGCDLNFNGRTNLTSPLAPDGGTYFIGLSTTNGTLSYRVGVALGADSENWQTLSPSSAATGDRYFTVPANDTGAERILSIRYERAGLQWVTTHNLNQPYRIDGGTVWVHAEVNHTWMKYSTATAYCSGLGSGWRVPTIGELSALVSNNAGNRYKIYFGSGVRMWSSTPNGWDATYGQVYSTWHMATSPQAWGVSTHPGEAPGYIPSEAGRAVTRCVKSK